MVGGSAAGTITDPGCILGSTYLAPLVTLVAKNTGATAQVVFEFLLDIYCSDAHDNGSVNKDVTTTLEVSISMAMLRTQQMHNQVSLMAAL